MFPDIPPGNNVQFRPVQVFGLEGSGKTALYRAIAENAAKRYGANKVNAVVSISLMELINAINKKPIQLLFLDDAGVHNQSAPERIIAEKSIIRRHLEAKRKNGIIGLYFAVQDYFMLAKQLRSTLYVEFLKSAPTNLSDLSTLERIIGPDAIGHLKACQEEWLIYGNYDALSYPVVRVLDQIGFYEYKYIDGEDSILQELTTSYNRKEKEKEKREQVIAFRKMLSKKRFPKDRRRKREKQIALAIEGFKLGLSKSQIKGLMQIGDEKVNAAEIQYQEEQE